MSIEQTEYGYHDAEGIAQATAEEPSYHGKTFNAKCTMNNVQG